MTIVKQTIHTRRRRAVTLVESMMLMVVLSIIVLGTGIAFQTLADVPKNNNSALTTSSLLIDKMESLRALGFTTLSTTASSNDSVTINNLTYARSWTITKNPGSAYDNNFIQIVVTIGGRSLTSAVCSQ